MNELFFALKTLLMSALLVTLMQVRVSGISLEMQAQSWLQNSSVAHFVQGAATGGVLACRDLYISITDVWKGSSHRASAKASK
jgi:hypothetical protein